MANECKLIVGPLAAAHCLGPAAAAPTWRAAGAGFACDDLCCENSRKEARERNSAPLCCSFRAGEARRRSHCASRAGLANKGRRRRRRQTPAGDLFVSSEGETTADRSRTCQRHIRPANCLGARRSGGANSANNLDDDRAHLRPATQRPRGATLDESRGEPLNLLPSDRRPASSSSFDAQVDLDGPGGRRGGATRRQTDT